MNLTQLLKHSTIGIQCHDTPDADAIASGFGLYSFFKYLNKDVTLFYSGRNRVTKPDLVRMIDLLDIPLQYLPEAREWPGLLITVDGQYGAGNVSLITAPTVAVIDHHVQEGTPPPLHDIRPFLGSCSTLVWTLLREAGFEPSERPALATALYYGLYMDTGSLSEVRHPLDRDLRDAPGPVERTLKILMNSLLSLADMALTSDALANLIFNKTGRFALVHVQPCDPNVLGYISDLVMQVDPVDVALVYSEVSGGIKYSVRTIQREVRAAHIASWLASGGLGSGGGHDDKAGGWISRQNFTTLMPGQEVGNFFSRRLLEYHAAYDIIDCGQPGEAAAFTGRDKATLYRKQPLHLGYVSCGDVFPGRPVLHIRMLEGDINIKADPDTYLMVGLEGEVYPITRQMFERTYETLRDEELPDMQLSYNPVVMDRDSGQRVSLNQVAGQCRLRTEEGSGRIRAMQLLRGLKLFTAWDTERYIKGEPGDWLVWPEDRPDDLYIITAALFPRLYAQHDGNGPVEDLSSFDLASRDDACPETIKVRKKPHRVKIRFATSAGEVETLEGIVPYPAGYALITGEAGEVWPVSPEHLAGAYAPEQPEGEGQDGVYTARPAESLACRRAKPFFVRLDNGAVLRGKAGDWLLQYDSGDKGVVSGTLFSNMYEKLTDTKEE